MFLPWSLVTIASVLFIVYKLRSGKSNLKKQLSNLHLIITVAYQFFFKLKSEDRLGVFKYIHKYFPRYFRINFFGHETIMLYDPDLLKKVFNSQSACQRPYRNCIQLECGLLSSEYHYWKTSRKHLNVAFNQSILKGFVPVFDSFTTEVVKDLEANLDGKVFDLLFPLTQLTTRSVAATLLNVRGVESSSYQKLIDSVALFLDILLKRIIMPFWNYDCIFKWTNDYKLEKESRQFAMDYGDDLIREARKRQKVENKTVDENGNAIEKKGLKVNYVIDQLINHEEKFTDQEIREHLMTLLVTASETSANYVATAIMYLAINQEIQQKVYDEICEVYCDDSVQVDYDNLGSLKYLEMVLKETLRLFSPIPISIRETIEELDIGLEKPLRKGACILIFNYVLHQRKDLWGRDAGKFNPDRFLPENVSQRDPYSFLPFNAGPRMCIGARYAMISSKIEVMRLIKAYKFTTNMKESEIKMKLAFTGKMSTKHLVTIHKRN